MLFLLFIALLAVVTGEVVEIEVGATCVDGSHGRFYVSFGTNASLLIVAIGSGSCSAMCFNNETCQEAPEHVPSLSPSLSSQSFAAASGSLLSSSSSSSPFSNFTRILIPDDCTRDFFLGQNELHQGERFIEEAVRYIEANLSVSTTTTTLLTGNGAGSYAALLNAHRFAVNGSSPIVFLDGWWLADYEIRNNSKAKMGDRVLLDGFYNQWAPVNNTSHPSPLSPACVARYPGNRGAYCLAPIVAVESLMTDAGRLLIFASQADTCMLMDSQMSVDDDQWMQTLALNVTQSLLALPSSVSFVAPRCLYAAAADDYGRWRHVSAGGSSETVENLLKIYVFDASVPSPRRLYDTCTSINCNGGCFQTASTTTSSLSSSSSSSSSSSTASFSSLSSPTSLFTLLVDGSDDGDEGQSSSGADAVALAALASSPALLAASASIFFLLCFAICILLCIIAKRRRRRRDLIVMRGGGSRQRSRRSSAAWTLSTSRRSANRTRESSGQYSPIQLRQEYRSLYEMNQSLQASPPPPPPPPLDYGAMPSTAMATVGVRGDDDDDADAPCYVPLTLSAATTRELNYYNRIPATATTATTSTTAAPNYTYFNIPAI